MITKRVFVAFDYADHDVKQGLIEQSNKPGSPIKLIDESILTPVANRWPAEAERLIKGCDWMIVLCGEQTHQAEGVAIELQIAQRLGKPYFLLRGTRVGVPTRPRHARASDPIYTYTWRTVETLIRGEVPPANAIVPGR